MELRREPAAIVCLGAQFTETLFALGLGSKVAGVSGGETHPPEATALPRVVGDDGVTPDAGTIAGMRPDLVLAAGAPGAPWKAALREAGIPVVTFDATSLADALADIRTVGRLAGASDRAAELAGSLEAAGARIAAAVAGRALPTVFVEAGVTYPPLVTATPRSLLGDLVARAGGKLVTEDGPEEYPEWPPERLLQADPEVYLVPRSVAAFADDVGQRRGFEGLQAVRKGRVHVLDDALVFVPGPRIVEGLRGIAAALHPDVPL